MHRSRIGVVLIDHPADRFDAALSFWAAATGVEVSPPAVDDAPFASLGAIGSVYIGMQRTGDGTPSRLHLDIETDDVAAEVARLTAAGAEVAEQRDGYVIMRDPGGVLFCIVPVQTGALFAANAHEWNDDAGATAPAN